MKKAIGITACILLGGCGSGAPKVDMGPDRSTKFPYQDVAPVPWVRMVPSERTIAFKEVNFTTIAEQIRYDLNFAPHREKFQYVRMVLVDYTVLPHENATPPSGANGNSQDQTPNKSSAKNKKTMEVMPMKVMPMEANNEDYSTKFESRPQRYVMTLSFYDCDKLPPDPPSHEETIFMRTDKAAPQEAMRQMAHTIIEDIHASPLRKLKVSLD